MKLLGLMSGTSLDGIDAAVVELSGSADALTWSVLGFVSVPYTPARRALLRQATEGGSAALLCRVHTELGEWLAEAARAGWQAADLEARDIDLIGSHGQTVWHEPPTAGQRGATLQIGCPATLAERTGIPVVSDFRARDVAVGGEGAPLVPWVDRALFAHPERARVLQNIGGIGNLTWVPPRGHDEPLVAFDTGPGNVLLDAAAELASHGAETFDRDGVRALRGRVDEELLAELMSHPFLNRRPPRSTGRELFGRTMVEDLVKRRPPADDAAWDDLLATLTAFTAHSIAGAIERWTPPAEEVLVSGGGAANPALMRALGGALAPRAVHSAEAALGVNPDAKEAVAFAVLAWAFVRGVPANEPVATGAGGRRVLGSFTPGAQGRPGAGALGGAP
ncbi:MAG: anhydro-N-acetylmuramic acid kinase [Gemmatimonadota bacterium]